MENLKPSNLIRLLTLLSYFCAMHYLSWHPGRRLDLVTERHFWHHGRVMLLAEPDKLKGAEPPKGGVGRSLPQQLRTAASCNGSPYGKGYLGNEGHGIKVSHSLGEMVSMIRD